MNQLNLRRRNIKIYDQNKTGNNTNFATNPSN